MVYFLVVGSRSFRVINYSFTLCIGWARWRSPEPDWKGHSFWFGGSWESSQFSHPEANAFHAVQGMSSQKVLHPFISTFTDRKHNVVSSLNHWAIVHLQLQEEIAKQLGVPVECQRFWLWAKRQNHTYRPNRPLTDQEEAQTVIPVPMSPIMQNCTLDCLHAFMNAVYFFWLQCSFSPVGSRCSWSELCSLFFLIMLVILSLYWHPGWALERSLQQGSQCWAKALLGSAAPPWCSMSLSFAWSAILSLFALQLIIVLFLYYIILLLMYTWSCGFLSEYCWAFRSEVLSTDFSWFVLL